jgi:Lrp/AsnC family transcriptional regulator for asnA, asnC and gidA
MKLDEIDEKIIRMLQEDGRRSYSEIAEEVERTEVTIRRRVRRLVNQGIIKRFTVVLDPMKIGPRIRAIIRVKTMMKQATLIAEEIKGYDEVDEAYFLDGACGLMLKVTVDGLNELRNFLEKRLGKVPGVGEVETCIVLETIKSPL